ncbi:MAG: tRNA dihydrouridine(20/20a) synthase DusA [Gammaproteobacteria bacterium]|nr:tRNA dihydrouridine(20/20a) synthase DusA [Gammaproteobacteria bacterium]MCW5583956.1 tRNA dihydrouridine(20/20a) synthase DusA [Gammaproteobacteria bacterium]
MSEKQKTHLISIAPMMDYTDRHCRYFLRLIAPDVLLYTEMITAQALVHGDINYLLAFNAMEHPIALQLGGSNPAFLAQGARWGEQFGYDEINLNVGCPSPRVSKGRFGACLMLEPSLVADCIAAMQAQVTVPVTVKCRIGVDDHDSYEALWTFIKLIAQTGCDTFIIHARKAWLSGLSPKQNREIPPLRYDVVHQVKHDFPHLKVILNGGIKTCNDIAAQLPYVDGVMIGRAAYSNPYLLAEIQAKYLFSKNIDSRQVVIKKFIPYIHKQLQKGIKLNRITRHILGLFQNQAGASLWRRYLSQYSHYPNADVSVVEQALALVETRSKQYVDGLVS